MEEELISIAPEAVSAAAAQLLKRGTPKAMIRLGVRGQGCKGFTYVIEFEDNPHRDSDYIFSKDGAIFVVDKKSMVYLRGMTLIYEKTLMFTGFKFSNPNEKSSCGCGKSFGVE